jgi:acetyl-CoA synthase
MNQPIPKGRCIDPIKGEWEGVNEFVYKYSNRAVERFCNYSIMEYPTTSCGCFECIIAIIPECNGFMVVNRGYTGMTPVGMTFSTLAGSVGGGNQTPGFLGVGRLYLLSKKFLVPEGGLKRIVWMTKELKEFLGDKLKKRCEEIGEPDLVDKIADETITTDAAQLLEYLTKVNHPALSLPPLI